MFSCRNVKSTYFPLPSIEVLVDDNFLTHPMLLRAERITLLFQISFRKDYQLHQNVRSILKKYVNHHVGVLSNESIYPMTF